MGRRGVLIVSAIVVLGQAAVVGAQSASAALAGNGPKVGSPSWMITSRSASGYERVRNATTSSTLKMPAVPPMPVASVRTAATANDGLRRNCLTANSTSCQSDSISGNPCSSRVDSLTRSTLPNSRLALIRASQSVRPWARKSAASRSR